MDAALAIAEAFERPGISYALGGALACGLWGVPRATIDVDVNVFVDEAGLPSVFDALEGLGVSVHREGAAHDSREQGMFVCRWGLYRVDVFTPSIGFSSFAEATRVKQAIGPRAAYFLSAEAIAVFKLLFFRTKDVADLEQLVAVQGDKLDAAWVRARIVEMMGEDDERTRSWDEMVRGARP